MTLEEIQKRAAIVKELNEQAHAMVLARTASPAVTDALFSAAAMNARLIEASVTKELLALEKTNNEH